MEMPETIKQISKIHSEVSSLYFSYEAACSRVEEAESRIRQFKVVLQWVSSNLQSDLYSKEEIIKEIELALKS